MSSREPPNPDDPLNHYLEHLSASGKAKGTIEWVENGMARLDEYLSEVGKTYGEVNDNDCINFIDWLRDGTRTDRTVKNYCEAIRLFYGYYNTRGTYEVNPMEIAMEDVEIENDTSPYRRELSIDEMREGIQKIDRPRQFAVVILLLKTGMRSGEVCNLDLRDIHLRDPKVKQHLPDPRPVISDIPNSIFVSSNISAGDVVNGERRNDANKRKRDTIIPIDDELQRVLKYYIAARVPARSEANPLITIDTHPGKNGGVSIGDRLNTNAAHQTVKRFAEMNGWYEKGAGVNKNVTPHYCRHFFTTNMRSRTDDDVFVKFIRGDVGDDIIDNYTHNWGDKVRSTYLNHIYKLFDE